MLAIDRLAAGHCRGSSRTTVVRSLHHDNIGLPCVRACDLDTGLDSFGARVPQEKCVERGVRHDREQLFDQLNLSSTVSNIHLCMRDSSTLLLRCASHSGMAVSQINYTNAAGQT